MSTQLTSDDAKRLLVCMQLGILIQHADGHRYITADAVDTDEDGGWDFYGVNEDASPLNMQLVEAGFEAMRGKQYGSLRSCLDVIDAALYKLSRPNLREMYDAGGDMLWGFDT